MSRRKNLSSAPRGFNLLFTNSINKPNVSALPAKPCAQTVRFFRKGLPLRSSERKNRALDGADG